MLLKFYEKVPGGDKELSIIPNNVRQPLEISIINRRPDFQGHPTQIIN